MGDSNMRASDYQTGKTVQEIADEWAQDLVNDVDTVDEEVSYGMETEVVATITLAGGGPAAVAEFQFEAGVNPEYLYDHTPYSGKLIYREWGAVAEARFSDPETVWWALNRGREQRIEQNAERLEDHIGIAELEDMTADEREEVRIEAGFSEQAWNELITHFGL